MRRRASVRGDRRPRRHAFPNAIAATHPDFRADAPRDAFPNSNAATHPDLRADARRHAFPNAIAATHPDLRADGPRRHAFPNAIAATHPDLRADARRDAFPNAIAASHSSPRAGRMIMNRAILALLLIGFLANPSLAKHQEAITAECRAKNPLTGALGAGSLVAAGVEYKNRRLFSLTPAGEKSVSFGAFGFIKVRDLDIGPLLDNTKRR